MSFSVFFGATFGSLLVPKVALGVVLEASKNDAKKGLKRFYEFFGIFKKWGGGLAYNNLSVAVLGLPLGPWSPERGGGLRLGTGHALRSKRGGGYTCTCLYIHIYMYIYGILANRILGFFRS